MAPLLLGGLFLWLPPQHNSRRNDGTLLYEFNLGESKRYGRHRTTKNHPRKIYQGPQ